MSDPNDWLTKREAAEYLKVSVRQMGRLPLPRTFVASSPMYDRADLDEISEAIAAATAKVTEFAEVKDLEESIGTLLAEMGGPRQDITHTSSRCSSARAPTSARAHARTRRP